MNLDSIKKMLNRWWKTAKGWVPNMEDRKTWIWIGGAVVGVIVVVIAIFGALVYRYRSTSPIVKAVSKVVPFPVEKVNGRYVSYSEYLFELGSLNHYCGYSKSNNLPPEPVCKDASKARQGILDQLKETAVVKGLLDKYNISVTTKELDDQVKQLTDSTGGEAKVRQALRDVYGWTYADLRRKVEFQLARQKLQEKIAGDDALNAPAKAKAEEVLKKAKAGEDFAGLAKKYSQDEGSASSGGDLNFFGKGKMVAEFEAAAFAVKPGQIVDHVVKTRFGYHIIKVTEKKGDQVRASHILIKSVDFESYMKQRVLEAKAHTYIKA